MIWEGFEKKNVIPFNPEAFKLALSASGGSIIEEAERQHETKINTERFELFPPDILRSMELMAKAAEYYLRGPMIQDPFGDDDTIDPWKRREWRASLVTEFGDEARGLLEMNRMRPNLMTTIYAQADRLNRKLQVARLNSPDAARVHKAVQAILAPMEPLEGFGQRYIHAPLNERVEVVRMVSAAARDYLNLVTEQEHDSRLSQAA